MELLRFITAGSVDDGKSTLIGRLLYDSGAVSLDVLEAIERSGKQKNEGELDLSLLTDGLRAEREQGITIDVAYKYFTTARRKFIIADAPGHVQYTRNMITAASNADLAVILIDARHGVIEQTRRHSVIASLVGIPHIVVAVNKMDLVDYSQTVFEKIKEELSAFIRNLGFLSVAYIPVSAKLGINIAEKSPAINWYNGNSLLRYLEELQLRIDIENKPSRFQVQYVIRPQTDELHDYRGYAGTVISGVYSTGDEVTVLPAEINTTIARIELNGKEVEQAHELQPVIIHLSDDVDVSRGNSIVKISEQVVIKEFQATICWMSEKKLTSGTKLLLQHLSCVTRAVVQDIVYKTDINTLAKIDNEKQLSLNEIALVSIKTALPLTIDKYKQNKRNGSFILVDESGNDTLAAGVME